MFRLSLTLVLLALHGASAAAPSVFVRSEQGRSWWNTSTAESRVIGTSAGIITTAKLSKFVEDTVIYDAYKVCALSPVSADTYVGVDKAMQDEINATTKLVTWRFNSRTPNGVPLLIQSVLFEPCDGDVGGAAVLVTDAQSGEIMLWQPMGSFNTSSNVTKPVVTAFLKRPEAGDKDPPLFSYSSCTECGESTAVYYDVTRRKLYTVYNGH
jgi:hypothetical protein